MSAINAVEEPADLERRFAGIDRLYGVEAALRIKSSHVAVVGIGGVGSWAVEALARSGVANISLIDMDHVAPSNVNRQVHALTQTIGLPKVKAMARRVQEINPVARIRCIDDFVSPENWPGILPEGVDAVIDACDHLDAKFAMSAWSLENKELPFVTVGAAGGKRHGQAVEIEDIVNVTHDPLLAKLRYRLRRENALARSANSRIRVACVFSREPVQSSALVCRPQEGGTLNCHGYGSLVSVTAIFGMVAAGWVIEKMATTVSEFEKAI